MAQWEEAQKKAFTKWINGQLGEPLVNDIITDLQDGVVLLELCKKLFPGIPVPKYSQKPKMRVHKLDNCQNALDMIAQAGVKLEFVKPVSIVDGNQTLILGLIWTLICEASIKTSLKAIGVTTGKSGGADQGLKELLLAWCRKRTEGYSHVNIKDFTDSFKDGLAFCAIIHSLNPRVLKYDALYPENGEPNLRYAFQVAEKKLGIPALLDVEDMRAPDEKSVMTYVSEFLKYYAANDTPAAAARQPSEAELARQQEQELARRRADDMARLRRLEEEERLAQLEAEKQRLAEGIERQRRATEAERIRQLAEMEQLRAEQQRQQEAWAKQQADLLAQQQALEKQRQDSLARAEQQRAEEAVRQRKELERQRLDYERRQSELLVQQQQAAEEARQAREESERQRRKLERERQVQQAAPPPQQAYPPVQVAVPPPMTGQMGHHVKKVVKKKKSKSKEPAKRSTSVTVISAGGGGGARVIRTGGGTTII